jgi:S-adenosyl-L-methionine hydrolase (adenosine-forming)
MNVPIVAILTDFGTSDPYVGVMKGVILSRCPAAQCIDLTHKIAPQNVRQASYLLQMAYRYFPPHTVFLAVVDPGVGTSRHPLAIATAQDYFVGPDNGIFSGVLAQTPMIEAVVLSTPAVASQTFHGRDVFAPAAAALANGAAISTLGTPISEVQCEDWLRPTVTESAVRGEVIHIDHFGNAITSIGACRWSVDGRLVVEAGDRAVLTLEPSTCEVRIGKQHIEQVVATYGLTRQGSALALISSDGQLEIAVNGGSAAQQLQIQIGDAVELRYHR